MRSLRALGETNDRLISMSLRHRTWLLLACAAALGLFAVVLGTRAAVQRVQSLGTASLATVGITPVTPPKSVPSFGFADEAGNSLSLADFKGRAVLLNLWATWCVPCREEMPSLDRLQAKLGGPGFQVVAVSIDRQGVSVVRPFYRKLALRSLGIHFDPSGRAPSVLGNAGLPATLLIDAQGREVGRKLGPLEWDSTAVIGALRHVFKLSETNQKTSASPEERNSP